MALDPSNSGNLEQLVLKGLICRQFFGRHAYQLVDLQSILACVDTRRYDRVFCR